MGYTHYWRKKPHLDPKAFAEFTKDVEKIIRNCGVDLHAEFDEESPPEIKEDHVRFNGIEEAGHETFYFDRDADRVKPDDGLAFAFCKTAQKPYDIAVCAVLIAAKKHFQDNIKVSSDGDENDWADGFELADRLLGYTATLNADDRELEVS